MIIGRTAEMLLFLLIVLIYYAVNQAQDNQTAEKKKARVKIETVSRPSDCGGVYSSIGDTLVIKSEGESEMVVLGGETTMPGLNRGLHHMCVGEKRILEVPPEYLPHEQADVTGKTFEVELISIDKSAKTDTTNVFSVIDQDADSKISRDELLKWFHSKHGDAAEMPSSLWEKEDVNKDGFISWTEFRGPKGEDEL